MMLENGVGKQHWKTALENIVRKQKTALENGSENGGRKQCRKIESENSSVNGIGKWCWKRPLVSGIEKLH
jgi:hypothetical protein